MKMIIYRPWLKFIVFILACSLTELSFAQETQFDLSDATQQSSNKNLQKKERPRNILGRSNIPPLRNENAGIWKKVGRGELLIGGVEVIGITTLILLPKEITGWSDDWTLDAWRNLKRSFRSLPVWDKDDWPLNYIGHPVAGSYYYNSLRSQHASVFQSFLFATAQSFIWEYIIEATAEKPSAQDLIITPIAGAILGESTHLLTMNMRRNGFNLFEKIFVLIFNPLFVINNGFGPRFNPVKESYTQKL